MKFIKKLLCSHDYKFAEKHSVVSENLWKCSKCGQYYVQHYGLGIGSKFSEKKLLEFWK